ncbi:MAG: nucleoside-diphosphate sugar epimerase/dehydratase, partial [Bacteroidales bacterium]
MTTIAEPTITVTRPRTLQPSEHRILLLAGDLIIAAIAVVVALRLWTITAGLGLGDAIRSRGYWFLAVPAWLVGLAPARYTLVALDIRQTVRALARVACVLLIGYLAVYFYAPRQTMPRLLALYFLWDAVLLTLAWRLAYIWTFTETAWRKRSAIVGAGEAGRRIVDAMLASGARDTEVVAFIDDDPARWGEVVQGVPVAGGHQQLAPLVREGVSQIVLAVPETSGGMLQSLVACQEAGAEVVRMATVYEDLLKRLPVEYLEPNWLFSSYADAVRAKGSS